VVALRFGSESYAKGDHGKAQAAFTEALDLFNLTGNKRGIGACQNNLAVANLAIGNNTMAEQYSVQAIQNADDLLRSIEHVISGGAEGSKTDVNKARRVLSDRRGNLAIIYLQQKRFLEAFQLIEELLLEDKKNLYIRGMVVKQGTLGEYYLTQGEIASAERVFASALDFIRRRDEMLFSNEWNGEEAEMSEEIALFNWATLQERKRLSNVEEYFLAALCKTTTMHMATTSKILLTLMRLLNSKEDVDKLKQIAAAHSFDLDNATGMKAVTASKRVAFVIDYSGSMSGSKIRSAIENVQNIFETHIFNTDYIMVTTLTVLFPLNCLSLLKWEMKPESQN